MLLLTIVGGAEIIGLNTYLANGFSHHYHLADSTSSSFLRASGVTFLFLFFQ